jgi:ribosomal-protein-alanine N-acetyltransferase
MGRILEIEEEAFPKTAYPQEVFLYYAARLPDTFVVIETDEHIAGYMIFHVDGHIRSMAVEPAFRRKGLGKKLFMHASGRANKELWLEVRSKNRGAIAFYRKMGMEIVGSHPGYYGDDDALIMVLKDSVWLKMRSLGS